MRFLRAECVVSLVGSLNHLCNPCNSIVWIKSSPFCPEDVDKLSNLIKSFVSSFRFCILVHVIWFVIDSVFGMLISGDQWRCCLFSEFLRRAQQTLPLSIGSLNRPLWAPLIEKVQKRLTDWKGLTRFSPNLLSLFLTASQMGEKGHRFSQENISL